MFGVSAQGRGRPKGPRRQEGGRLSVENLKRGGLPGEGWGGRGRQCLQEIWGGAKCVLSGPKKPPSTTSNIIKSL